MKLVSKLAKRKKLFLIAVAITAVLFSGGVYYNHLRDPLPILQPDDSGGGDVHDEVGDIARNFDKDIINFILLGFDRTAPRDRIYRLYRPDTILVASVNFRTGDINLLSIPRDSYVLIFGTGKYDKINHSFMYGHEAYGLKEEERYANGIKTVIKTVEELLGGVPLHYYVTVDMDGVVEIVDKLGGIQYDVEMNIYETDGRLMVQKGDQLLNGQDYLMYARYRGVGGDIGRSQRQQKILITTVQQLKQAGKLVKLPGIYKSLTETVDTNLNLNQMAALALYGSEVDLSRIKTFVMPGFNQWGPQGEIDVAYWVINEKERVDVIKEVFGVEVPGRSQITLPGPRQTPSPGEEEDVPSPGHPGGEGDENPDELSPSPFPSPSPSPSPTPPGQDDPAEEPGEEEESGEEHEEDEEDEEGEEEGEGNSGDPEPCPYCGLPWCDGFCQN